MTNHFCVVTPMFNSDKTLAKMLHSLYGQSYDDWELILIDDASSSVSVDECKRTLDVFAQLGGQVTVIWNKEKKWEMFNVLHGASLCRADDVVVRLDADDFLSDLDAFRIIDQVYVASGTDVLWTNHRWFDDSRVTNFNVSGPMQDHDDPYVTPWRASHLKTFRKKLLNNVPYENFLNMDNELIKRAGDQGLYLPILKRANKRIHLPLCCYSYRCDLSPSTFQTDDAKFQKAEADFLRQRGYVSSGPAWEEFVP